MATTLPHHVFTTQEIRMIAAFAVLFVLFVLFLTTTSWVEPFW